MRHNTNFKAPPENNGPIHFICLQQETIFVMVEEIVARLHEKMGQERNRWISDDEAMKMLRITSKTTLQKMRNEGKIKFSQPQKKIILYDRFSIEDFLEKNARNTF